jgi:hypothetical protein
MIYFIQPQRGGPVKIGYARKPENRLRELQCGNPYPLQIVAVVDGGWTTEAVLHKRFASGRMEGEWFEPDTPGLAALIAKAKAAAMTPVRDAALPWWSGLGPVEELE